MKDGRADLISSETSLLDFQSPSQCPQMICPLCTQISDVFLFVERHWQYWIGSNLYDYLMTSVATLLPKTITLGLRTSIYVFWTNTIKPIEAVQFSFKKQDFFSKDQENLLLMDKDEIKLFMTDQM